MDKIKVLMTNGSLMKVESIAECSHWSILKYFWPALGDNLSWKSTLVFFFSGRFKTGFTIWPRCKEQIFLGQNKLWPGYSMKPFFWAQKNL